MRQKNRLKNKGRELTDEEREGKVTTFHLCVPVKIALQKLMQGQNILTGTNQEAMLTLLQYEASGIEYYTGCSNETEEGRCGGHIYKRKQKNDEYEGYTTTKH